MGISSKLWRYVQWRRYFKAVPDSSWCELLLEQGTPIHRSERYDPIKGFYFPPLRTWIPKPNQLAAHILQSAAEIERLHQTLNVCFEFDGPDNLFANFRDVRVRITGRTDFVTMNEVFADALYGCYSPSPSFVIDVGANVGFSALFFAETLDCEVVAFELFPPTAKLAQANFAMNPDLKRRIELRTEGLGSRDETLELAYDPQNTAGMGIFRQTHDLPKVEVQVRDVEQVFRELKDRAGSRSIVLKLDCEGSEYPILDRLVETESLAGIDTIMIEFHPVEGRNHSQIVQTLARLGYRCFSQQNGDPEMGMIYAARSFDRT